MGIGDRSGVGGGVGGFFIVVWDGLGEGGDRAGRIGRRAVY